jgi:hypothetical protein
MFPEMDAKPTIRVPGRMIFIFLCDAATIDDSCAIVGHIGNIESFITFRNGMPAPVNSLA